jgi:hypothetical protein
VFQKKRSKPDSEVDKISLSSKSSDDVTTRDLDTYCFLFWPIVVLLAVKIVM